MDDAVTTAEGAAAPVSADPTISGAAPLTPPAIPAPAHPAAPLFAPPVSGDDGVVTNGQDQAGQNEETSQVALTDRTGQVDSQRGRAAYSSAEKTYMQWSEDMEASRTARALHFQQMQQDYAALSHEREMNFAFNNQDRQQTLRHNDLNHYQYLNNVNATANQALQTAGALATVTLQMLSGANTTDKMDARSVLEQMSSILDKAIALTPPTAK